MSNRRSGRLDTSQNYGNQQYIANNNRPNPSSYAARQIRPPGQTENTTATDNNPPLPRLPKGWRRYVDETSRVEYYWNEINAESTWTFPTVTAAEWIRSGQGSSIGITSNSQQHHNNNNSYQYDDSTSSYNYTTHSARPAVEEYDGQHNSNAREYGTDDENQSVGWNSDRGYYEDEHEFSDPYNNHHSEYNNNNNNAAHNTYHDDSAYNYNNNASYQQYNNRHEEYHNTSNHYHAQHHQQQQQQYDNQQGYNNNNNNNNNKTSSSKYALPLRPTTGSYYSNNNDTVRTLNRYGQRRNSNSKFRPSPPPGRKGANHETYFNNNNNSKNNNTNNKPLPLPPKMKSTSSSASAYVIPAYNRSNINNHNTGQNQPHLPHLNNNQLDEQQQHSNPEHFKFDGMDQYQNHGRANRSLSLLGKELFKDSSKVEIGDYISVLYNERWCLAQVLDFKDSDVPWVQVEIQGNTNVAEWIEFRSDRLKPFGADGALSPARKHLKVLSKRFSLADYVEVREKQVRIISNGKSNEKKKDKKKVIWKMAQIIALDVDGSVTVQYEGVNGVLGDEKISKNEQKERMRPLGESKTPKNSNKKSLLNLSEVKFRQKLKENGLVLEKMAPDGNCLFRAVAHQVYGDADKHDALRNACCDYMLSDGQKEHLENFVDGDFNKYVEKMRKPKTWGGNLEIEAMQEMFDRAIEIHSADVLSEETNETTFKKDFESSNTPETPRNSVTDVNQPISLKISYHGKSHYNSLVDPKHPPPLLPLESSRFQERRKRRAIAIAKQAEEKKEDEKKKATDNNKKRNDKNTNKEKMIVNEGNDDNNNKIEQKMQNLNVNTNNKKQYEVKKKGGLFGGFSIFKKSTPKTDNINTMENNNVKLKPIARSNSNSDVPSLEKKLASPESHEKKTGALPSMEKKMKDLHSRKLKRVSLSSPSMKMAKYGVLDKMNSIKMDSVEKNSVGDSVGSTSKVQDSEGPDDKKGSSVV